MIYMLIKFMQSFHKSDLTVSNLVSLTPVAGLWHNGLEEGCRFSNAESSDPLLISTPSHGRKKRSFKVFVFNIFVAFYTDSYNV